MLLLPYAAAAGSVKHVRARPKYTANARLSWDTSAEPLAIAQCMSRKPLQYNNKQ